MAILVGIPMYHLCDDQWIDGDVINRALKPHGKTGEYGWLMLIALSLSHLGEGEIRCHVCKEWQVTLPRLNSVSYVLKRCPSHSIQHRWPGKTKLLNKFRNFWDNFWCDFLKKFLTSIVFISICLCLRADCGWIISVIFLVSVSIIGLSPLKLRTEVGSSKSSCFASLNMGCDHAFQYKKIQPAFQ